MYFKMTCLLKIFIGKLLEDISPNNNHTFPIVKMLKTLPICLNGSTIMLLIIVKDKLPDDFTDMKKVFLLQ